MLPQVNVRILAVDNTGQPLSSALITAQLDRADTSEGYGYVLPEPVEGVCDAEGVLVLGLWPNELGTTGSKYVFTIENVNTGDVLHVEATIPNRDCDLHTVADPLASPDAVIATPVFEGSVVTGPVSMKKVNVTVFAADQNGSPVKDATITAQLNRVDVDPTVGYIMPEEITGVTDDTGVCVLAVWPNELGSTQSQYIFLIENPDTDSAVKVIATVPDAHCFLHMVANLPTYPGKSDGQLAVDSILELVAPVMEARDQVAANHSVVLQATATAVNASNTAKDAADSVVATAASSSANAAQASTSQLAALASEIAAEDARDVAISARDSAIAAKDTAVTKASEASTSATHAATSMTDADTAKTAAETAKTAAETARTGADSAKIAAETARDAAVTAKNLASDWAIKATSPDGTANKSAKSYASDAGASAIAANIKASEASTSADNAKASENIAKTAETNAATSAGTASTKAGEAAGSATAAATAATNAATSKTGADTAKTAAETAKTAAEAAKFGAETAQTGAQTAKTVAETARDLAQAWSTSQALVNGTVYYGAYKYALDAKAQADRAQVYADGMAQNQINADWNATSGAALILNKPVLFSGSYTDLANKPTIPTNTDQLTNGANFITSAEARTAISVSGALSYNSTTGVISYIAPSLHAIATSGSYADLANKPTIPAAQVSADWNAASGVAQILNKPTIPTNTSQLTNGANFITTAGARTAISVTGSLTYNSTTGVISYTTPSLHAVATSGSYADLTNKPTIPPAQVNSDWNAASGLAQILNKPTIPTNTNQLTNGANFITSAGAPVQSVAGKTGVVTLAKADVGLGNVDNVSDVNKPISAATQTALNAKEPTIAAGANTQFWRGDKTWQDFASSVRSVLLTGLSTASSVAVAATDSILAAIGKLQAQVSLKANKANDTLTGVTIKGYTEQFQTLNPGAAVTVDPAGLGTMIEISTTANITITLPNAVAGVSYTLLVKYGGAHTVTFAGGTSLGWFGKSTGTNTAPTATMIAGKIDCYGFICGNGYTKGRDGGRNG